MSDEELMRDIEEVSRKGLEEGRFYTLRTDEDIDEFFSEVQGTIEINLYRFKLEENVNEYNYG